MKLLNNRLGIYFYGILHRINHRKDYVLIDKILYNFHSTGGLINVIQPYKLFELRRLLLQHRPLSVLEFGTGSSSSIFVSYCLANKASLTCVDESEKWLTNTKNLQNLPEPADWISFEHYPKITNSETKPPECKYGFVPKHKLDFLLIDGPSLEIDGQSRKDAINSDVFSWPKELLPKIIVVDVRKATVDEIQFRCSDVYDCDYSDLVTRTLKYNYNYFSVFKLKGY